MRLRNDVLFERDSLLLAQATKSTDTRPVSFWSKCRFFVPFAYAKEPNVRKFVRFEQIDEEVERNIVGKVKACDRRREILEQGVDVGELVWIGVN